MSIRSRLRNLNEFSICNIWSKQCINVYLLVPITFGKKIKQFYIRLEFGINSIVQFSHILFIYISDADDDYYKWKAPGIGRNLFYSFTEGTVLFILLLMIEYEVFSKLIYYIEQKYFPKYPVNIENEDSDVAEQKELIRNSTEAERRLNYILTINDLTKYYKNFLAVNGLCLGVKKYECFGLLGMYYCYSLT